MGNKQLVINMESIQRIKYVLKIRNMKFYLPIILLFFYSISFSQSLSENEIKKIAQKINSQLKGVNLENGITVRGCVAVGRTLTYLYDVVNDWYPTENMKEDIIANFKESGLSEVYFNNSINAIFYYYKGSKIVKTISIKSHEFSYLNFSLGEYFSINGHPKAKGVNLKLKKPEGWDLEEGDRPNIVKKFRYKTNTFLILIKDNVMFLSRNESKELLEDDEYVKEFIAESGSSFSSFEILNHEIVTINSYPTLEFTIKGDIERSGIKLKMIMKFWVIFYEDKIICLQAGGADNEEFKLLENLYDLITISLIFPEQYN